MTSLNISEYDDIDDPDLSAYLRALDLEDAQIEENAGYPSIALENLLAKLSDPECRHCERYGEFVLEEIATLKNVLLSALTPQLVQLFEDYPSGSTLSTKSLCTLSSDAQVDGAAIYGHILWVPPQAPTNIATTTPPSTPSRTPKPRARSIRQSAPARSSPTKRSSNDIPYRPRTLPQITHNLPGSCSTKSYLYIGQATHLPTRISQHDDFRYRRDNPSFHYSLTNASSSAKWIVLASLPPSLETSRPDLTLNILEMFCALLLQSLQSDGLREWLPPTSNEEEKGEGYAVDHFPCNVALPLDHGDQEASRASLSSLKDSRDEFAVEYRNAVMQGRSLRPRMSLAAVEGRRRRSAVGVAAPAEMVDGLDDGGQGTHGFGSKIGEMLGVDAHNELIRGVLMGVFGTITVLGPLTLLWVRMNRRSQRFSFASF